MEARERCSRGGRTRGLDVMARNIRDNETTCYSLIISAYVRRRCGSAAGLYCVCAESSFAK